MARKLKFPLPSDYPAKFRAVLCPGDRVIGLYNQATDKDARRIAKKVKEWFHAEAHAKGWGGVHFLPEVQSMHGAGCVLWPPPGTVVDITVTTATLVLADSADAEEGA